MLSLGPGSACDVCLEPFGAELKAPCSIPCGHVFCVSCLQHLARPNCPLCRLPFNARNTVKLAIENATTDQLAVHSSTDEEARQLQKRISSVAVDGATEAQTTQITEDCKIFFATVPQNMVRARLELFFSVLR
ncbi:hypothetical protein DFH09DRAFT_903488 [Mycena vulgaris]|nr:hypothetical protein DFH09DRAFT_903488 [Mycena vulgaris]